jgi:hypothetical protein
MRVAYDAAMQEVSIDVDGTPAPFELDLEDGTWRSDADGLEEAEFPLVAEVNGKRYELYSDGTLNEEELAGS